MNLVLWQNAKALAATARAPRSKAADREFLPAALEIIETPPSPVAMSMLATICLFAVAAIGWAWFSRIDIVAVAQGKVQSAGRVKVVQPVDGGKVRDIRVQNGGEVREGDLLVQMEDGEAYAELRALAAAHQAAEAENLRREEANRIATSRRFADPPRIDWPVVIEQRQRDREERVLAGDLAQLRAAYEGVAAQRRQKEAESLRLSETIKAQEDLVGLQQERVDMRKALEVSRSGTRASVIDAMETMQMQRTQLAQQKGQLAEAQAAIEVADREAARLVDNFVAENLQKRSEAEKVSDELAQRLVKARLRVVNTKILAPVSGTVQSLTLSTRGQVVQAGEEIMRVVPAGEGVEVEAFLPNKDVGFVRAGQEAVVKVEAFPFTHYGTLPGHVVRVSREAIPEPDASAQEGGSTRGGRSVGFGGASRVQNLVFPITVKLDRSDLMVGEERIAIGNGMAVTVEIRTGERRVLEFLFAPLAAIGSSALKER